MQPQLEERLADLVEGLPDVGVEGGPAGRVEYVRNGVVFAVCPSTDSVELRLGAEIAEAARRTPDTSGSSRGADWVRFSPKEWDDHATDRLDAWFRVAWRYARQ
ncbi:MAG: hypothetical protein M3N29_03175 [Chloroflexota bacterium]|nr:hypothetical protein [Chloroflexota bacterium]